MTWGSNWRGFFVLRSRRRKEAEIFGSRMFSPPRYRRLLACRGSTPSLRDVHPEAIPVRAGLQVRAANPLRFGQRAAFA